MKLEKLVMGLQTVWNGIWPVPWSTLVVRLAGGLTAMLGLVVLVGWHTHQPVLVQVLPVFAPMQYNTALSFLFCGVGLLSVVLGRHRVAIAAAGIVGAIGVLTLIEYLLGVDLRIDQLLWKHDITVKTTHAGRMAWPTALSFLVSGATLVVASRPTWPGHQPLILSVLGSVIAAVGIGTFFGYLAGTETPYGWENSTYMAVHTALGFGMFGLGVFVFAWREEMGEESGLPRWLPIPVGIGLVMVAVALWLGLALQERSQMELRIEAEAVSLSGEIKEVVEARLLAVARMAKRWESRGGTPRKEWQVDAGNYTRDQAGLHAVVWVDSSFHVRWIEPLGGHEFALGKGLRAAEQQQLGLQAALERREMTVTLAFDLKRHGMELLVVAPLFPRHTFDGFIVGLLAVEELLAPFVEEAAERGYSVALVHGGEDIYRRDGSVGWEEKEWGREVALEFQDVAWRVRVWPGSQWLAQARSRLPEVALVIGLLMGSLVALMVYLAQRERSWARENENVNRTLEAEIAERKRTEDMIRTVAEGISAETGKGFFRSLVHELGRTLGVAYAFIGEVSPGKEDHVSTVAVYAKGAMVDNFEYALADTPCEHVIGQQLCAHPSGVQQQFPLDTLLADMGVESYMGYPLNDAAGRGRGILAILDTKPLSHQERMESVFRIFGARAADELERKRVEEARETLVRQQAVVAELGQRALTGVELATLMDEAVARLAEVLGVEYCKTLELLPDGHSLRLGAGVGWKDGYVGHATVGTERDSQAGYTLLAKGAVIVEDLRVESRFSGPQLLRDHGVVSGMSVVIRGTDRPFGVLGVHTIHRRTFTGDDVHFLEAVAHILGQAVDRKRAEEALRRAHDELEARVVERTASLAAVNTQLRKEIGERTQAELALQASEARYHGIMDIAHEGIVSIDGAQRVVVFNQGASRIFGYAPEDVLGQQVDMLLPEGARTAHVHQVVEFLDSKESARGMGDRREIYGRRQNGEDFPAEASISKLEVSGETICTVVLRDITERKWLEGQLRQSMEKLEETVEQRTARVQELEAQRMQTEKLAALGQLAAGVAHEINNPLAGVRNAFLVIRDLIPAGHPDGRYIGMIEREIERMSEIVRQMYQLYRPEAAQRVPIDIVATLQHVVLMLEGTLKQHNLTVTTQTPSDFPHVTLPERDLIQVLFNFFQNAIDASPQGGTIVSMVALDNGTIRISVADQGPGIPAEVLTHLFEPFFSTKTKDKQGGMGLGLSVSRSLVEAMGGRIEIETKVGQGSTFTVVVPVDKALGTARKEGTLHDAT